MAILSGGRFTLGVGAGERLDEHITGEPFPSVGVRHEVFREALEIINLLWQGGYQSYRGQHLQLDAARVFELPDTPITLVVAAGGTQAATIAAELGGGLFATEPRADLVEASPRLAGRDQSTLRRRSPRRRALTRRWTPYSRTPAGRSPVGR